MALLSWPGLCEGGPATEPLAPACQAFEKLVFPKARVAEVKGHVVREGGTRMPGVQLELAHRREPRSLYVLSDDRGEFDFGSVPDGPYTLRTCASGFDILEVELDIREDAPKPVCELVLGPSEAAGERDLRWLERE